MIGALPLIDATKLDDSRRRAVHLATAAVTGFYVAVTVGGSRKALKTVAGLAAAGVTLRFADAGDAIDSRLERRLRVAGARHPRRWMAVGAAALTFAGYLGDRAAARQKSVRVAADAEDLEGVDDLIDGWPKPSEVTYVLDGPDGKTRPLK